MLKDLHKLRPFRITTNRCHEHFQEITLCPLVGQDMEEKFFSWLEKHKKQIAMGYDKWSSEYSSPCVKVAPEQ